MRRIILLAGLALAIGVLLPASALPAAGSSDLPFKGTVVGSATFPLDPTCPTGRRTWSAATGTASHLGRVTMVTNHCTPPANVITDGQMTLVAANGDELHMTYSGTCDFDPLAAVGDVFPCNTVFVVAGGTGRFQGATGTAPTTALITFAGFGAPEWPGTWRWEGQLTY